MTALRLVAAAGLLMSWSGVCAAQVRQVNIQTDATDPGNLGDTEPSIAVNPTNPLEIAVVAFSGNWGTTQNAQVWKSTDGGLTWTPVPQIPVPQAGLLGPGDQKVVFDRNGRLHVAELGSVGGGGANFDFILRQTGTANAVLAVGAAYGDDQPHLDVDLSAAGPCAGRMYSPWLNFGVANQRSMVTNSADRGVNVTNVGAGNNAAFPNRTGRVAIAPNGRVYLVYKTREGALTAEPNAMENAHFRVTRSDDCGATWNANGAGGVSIHGAGTVQTFFTIQFGNPAGGRPVARARSSDAWIAADPNNGDIYAVYVRRDASTFGQIYVARSTDQGVTWASTRVSDGTQHSAYPEIAVAGNGAIGVLYIDFVDNGTTTQFRHRFARSFDSGATWNTQVLQSTNPAGLAGAATGFLWGDYEGLTAFGNTFYGVYTGQATGRTTPQFDAIFFRDSAFPKPPKIQVTSPLVFPDSCGVAPVTKTLDVCNSGGGPLTVLPITSSSPAFSVVPPSSGFPVTIGAGSCFPFQVTFTPVGPGPASATLTIPSDDPANLAVPVTVTANVGRPTAVTVIADTGSFGELCAGPGKFRDLPLTIANSGSCTLTVSSIASSSLEFELPQVLSFPITVGAGDSTAVPIRFHPSSSGAKSANITIATNDPSAPAKTVAVTGSVPPSYVCEPPVFAAVEAAVGPAFGTGQTGNFTYNGSALFLGSFGSTRTFGIQAQGEYMFYPGRQEGQFDAGLLYRRGPLQFGAGGSFKTANLRAEASSGSLSHATLTLDVLLPTVRFGIFGSKGLRETDVVTLSEVVGPPGLGGSPIIAMERLLHTADQLGGAFQVQIVPNTWVDANLEWLHRHAPGVSDTAGFAARLSRLFLPGIVGTIQLDINESFLRTNAVGTLTFGVSLGRWSRPSDYSNPRNPLGTRIPRIRYDLYGRVR
jgi:hypothetical protein